MNVKAKLRLPYGKETRFGKGEFPSHCHDCGHQLGKIHMIDCDVEECPECHHQLLMCECNDGKGWIYGKTILVAPQKEETK